MVGFWQITLDDTHNSAKLSHFTNQTAKLEMMSSQHHSQKILSGTAKVPAVSTEALPFPSVSFLLGNGLGKIFICIRWQ